MTAKRRPAQRKMSRARGSIVSNDCLPSKKPKSTQPPRWTPPALVQSTERRCRVYWLVDDTCVDPLVDGYIGISFTDRFFHKRIKVEHRHSGKDFNGGPWAFDDPPFKLFTGTRAECLAIEPQLRPLPGIGKNKCAGGLGGRGHCASTREKMSKRTKAHFANPRNRARHLAAFDHLRQRKRKKSHHKKNEKPKDLKKDVSATPQNVGLHPNEIIRWKDCLKFFGLREYHLRVLIRNCEIPKPMALTPGGRAKGWLGQQILDWQAALVEHHAPSMLRQRPATPAPSTMERS